MIFAQGSVAYTSVVPVSGSHITNDVAVGLRTPQNKAEEIKKKYGCALASLVNPSESIEVEGVGGRKARSVLRRHLCEIIEPRAEELLNFIQTEIEKSRLSAHMGSGVVLTGGGAQLDGLCEMGEFVFDMPIRTGVPAKVGGLSDAVRTPGFATVIGVLLYAADQVKSEQERGATQFSARLMNSFKGLVDKVF
jgi:cell division protein FtsA